VVPHLLQACRESPTPSSAELALAALESSWSSRAPGDAWVKDVQRTTSSFSLAGTLADALDDERLRSWAAELFGTFTDELERLRCLERTDLARVYALLPCLEEAGGVPWSLVRLSSRSPASPEVTLSRLLSGFADVVVLPEPVLEALSWRSGVSVGAGPDAAGLTTADTCAVLETACTLVSEGSDPADALEAARALELV
jgi:hypothetical protein